MDFQHYQKKFTEKALQAGYSADKISKCLAYAEKLFDNGVPVIYNMEHLSGLVGYNTTYISRAIDHTKYFYKTFEVPKRNGNKRKISEPLPSLKEIQYWILHEILYKVEPSVYAKAYVPLSSLKQNLIFHRNQSMVLTLDIKDFFTSIDRVKIGNVFKTLGYSLVMANLLSKLCSLEDSLPQGAPTSPYLSNLILKEFDDEIASFCLPQKIRYTRYADDLAFSGTFNKTEIIGQVEQLLKKTGLVLNGEKTKLMSKGDRQIVTGIVVNEKLQARKELRLDIRKQMYFIKKFGMASHIEKIKNEKANYFHHLLGQINFIIYLNQDDKEFIEYRQYLNDLNKQKA